MAIKFLNSVNGSSTLFFNGADDNSGKADFAVKATGSNSGTAISLRSGQFQFGGDDINYEFRMDSYSSTANVRSWDRDIYIRTQSGSTSHHIAFITANLGTDTEKMRITGDGNVGIGTTTPTAPLHIEGGTTNEVLKVEADANPFMRFVQNGTNVGFIQFTGSSAYVSNMSNGSLLFRTNNTDKVAITNTGNVGIGTTSPTHKLSVSGPLKVVQGASDQTVASDSTSLPDTTGAEFFRIEGNYTDGKYTHEWAKIDRGGNLPLYLRESKGTANAFSNLARFGNHSNSAYEFEVFGDINATGNLYDGGNAVWHAGNFTPSNYALASHNHDADYVNVTGDTMTGALTVSTNAQVLTIQGTDHAYYAWNPRGTGRKAYAGFSGAATTNFTLMNEDTGSLLLGTNGSVYQIITSTGNVGIGTASPSAKLHVKGAGEVFRLQGDTGQSYMTFFQGTGGRVGYLGTAGSSGIILESSDQLQLYSGSSESMRITSTGNVGIGTTSPSQKLEVAGNIELVQQLKLNGDSPYIWGTGTGAMRIKHTSGNTMYIRPDEVGLISIFEGAATPQTVNFTVGAPSVVSTSNNSTTLQFTTKSKKADGTAQTHGVYLKAVTSDIENNYSRLDVTGANTYYFDNRVGIGTASPAALLDVNGTAQMSTGITENIHYAGTGFQHWGDGGTGIDFPANDNVDIITASSSRLRVDPSGNVGIGTTSISDGDLNINDPRLHVRGVDTTGAYSLVARFQAGSDADNTGAAIAINHSNDRGLLIKAGRKDSDRPVAFFDLIDSNGSTTNMLTMGEYGSDFRTGIGTTAPVATLDVAGTGRFTNKVQITGSTTIGWGDIANSYLLVGTDNAGIGIDSNEIAAEGSHLYFGTITSGHNIVFRSGGLNEMWMTSDTLFYKGGFRAGFENAAGDNTIYLQNTGGTGVSKLDIGGTVLIEEGGNVGIGTTAPDEKLEVSGNIKVTGDIVSTATSLYDLLPSCSFTYTMNAQLTADTWTEVFAGTTVLPSSGTYIVQVFLDDHAQGGQAYDEYYSGTMSWKGANTNETGYVGESEIVLHRNGHAANNQTLYLRTLERALSTSSLEVKVDISHTAATNIIFKFVRVI